MDCENDRSEGKCRQHSVEYAGGLHGTVFTRDIVLLCAKKHCDTLDKEAAVQGITRDDTNITVASV